MAKKSYNTMSLLDYIEGELDAKQHVQVSEWRRSDARLDALLAHMLDDRAAMQSMPDPQPPASVLRAAFEELGLPWTEPEESHPVPASIPFPQPTPRRHAIAWAIAGGIAAAILISVPVVWTIWLGDHFSRTKEVVEDRIPRRERVPRLREPQLVVPEQPADSREEEDARTLADAGTEKLHPESTNPAPNAPTLPPAIAQDERDAVTPTAPKEREMAPVDRPPTIAEKSDPPPAVEEPAAPKPRNVFGTNELPVSPRLTQPPDSKAADETKRRDSELVPYDLKTQADAAVLINAWALDPKLVADARLLILTADETSSNRLIRKLSIPAEPDAKPESELVLHIPAPGLEAHLATLIEHTAHVSVRLYIPYGLQRRLLALRQNTGDATELSEEAANLVLRIPITLQLVR